MFLKRVWVKVTYLVEWLSLFPGEAPGDFQIPLLGESEGHNLGHPHFPVFKPPGGRLEGPGSEFECQYPNMPGYRSCSTPEDRSCWLVNDKTGDRFNITTDYEQRAPNGTDRYYQLYLNNDTINADGQWFHEAKLFNSSLPGPWIQACWGDRVFINVTNNLTTNGTSVHWHGLRQYQTMHMDGVNGVTQCPIAPNDSFVYILNTTQYGSSWYHSHYSVQYADGAQGPITIHGPASAPFDEPKLPLLMTDWSCNSAFQAIYPDSGGLVNRSILLNGTGDITRFSGRTIRPDPADIPPIYTLHFEPKSKTLPVLKRAKRYLLRLINTSYDTTFVFSIDNHMLRVVENDFVPIKSFSVSNLTIGIGSRYHVIVEADPVAYKSGDPPPTDTEFWIRTHVLSDCGQGIAGAGINYSQTGILRYDDSSTTDPSSKSWFDTTSLPKCGDEPISSLQPCVNWTVTGPSNNNGRGEVYNMSFANPPYAFSLAGLSWEKPTSTKATPFQIDYGDPIFLHLDEYERPWPESWVVIPENSTSNDWIILILNNDLFGAHPIHLHGHDFAVLYQGSGPLALDALTDPKIIRFPVVNPARRDVVLLPKNGAVVIAFKSDNPGNWLMHCHIAFHASEGLALQILERQADANAIWPHGQSKALKEAARVCNNWNDWVGDCNNWWNASCSDGKDRIHFFGDDSGI